MGDCTKSSKRIVEALGMKEASSTSLARKRTKFTSQQPKESKPSTTNNVVAVSPRKTTSPSGFFSDEFSTSRCSSNGSLQIVKDSLIFADLEVANFETEVSTCNNTNNNQFRDTSPLSEICRVSEEISSMDSPQKNQPRESCRKSSPEVVKMPTLTEIDEFFSAAEKYEQNRFVEKYNYDIVKDVALEGRYQWVRLNP